MTLMSAIFNEVLLQLIFFSLLVFTVFLETELYFIEALLGGKRSVFLVVPSCIFRIHCKNSRLSWYLHLTNFSMGMLLMILSLVKLCCRILKLATYSYSAFAFVLSLLSEILSG